MKKLLKGVFLLVLIVIVIGIAKGVSGNKKDNPDLKADTSTSQTKEEKPEISQVVYDADGIKITYKGIDESLMGKTVELLIENDTDKNYTIQARDVSVNGFVVDHTFSSDVPAGKKANDHITILSSSLEDNKITDIENIEFTFHIFNSDSWDDKKDSEIIKLNK